MYTPQNLHKRCKKGKSLKLQNLKGPWPLYHTDLFPMSSCIATLYLEDCTLQLSCLSFSKISVELIIFGLQYSASDFGNPPLWTSL